MKCEHMEEVSEQGKGDYLPKLAGIQMDAVKAIIANQAWGIMTTHCVRATIAVLALMKGAYMEAVSLAVACSGIHIHIYIYIYIAL